MKGKKILLTVFSLLATVGLIFSAAACTSDKENEKNPQTNGKENNGLIDNETPIIPFD